MRRQSVGSAARLIRGCPRKRLLHLLGCKVGKVRKVHNKHVPKGSVIKTSPRPGTYPAGKVVGIQVSSGPKKKKRHHHAVRHTALQLSWRW